MSIKKNSKRNTRKQNSNNHSKSGKNKKASWFMAFIIAFLVLLFIRLFVFQTFVVQNSSMAGNLLPGDWVIIDKTEFGPRVPMTLISVPFAPVRTKLSSKKYYLKWPQLPYYRLPGLSSIARNDIIAFNYPPEKNVPLDKKVVYIKRCIGLPGDTVQVLNNRLIVNHKSTIISKICYEYRIKMKEKSISNDFLQKYELNEGGRLNDYGEYLLYISEETAEKLKSEKSVLSIERDPDNADNSYVFPHNPRLHWTLSNYGSIKVPKSGDQITFTRNNIDLYREILEQYEKCSVSIGHDTVYINNLPLHSYFFKYDYYFVLDDNRDNGKDSRMWGFLPVTHIIGKVSRVLISFEPGTKEKFKIRYDRILKKL